MDVSDYDVSYLQIVFSITVQGYAELRDPQSALSLQERTVLTLIDGVCPVAQYLPYLSSFWPVVDKIKKLEQLALVRRIGAVSPEAVRLFDEQVKRRVSMSKWLSISSEREASGFVALR
jgi:hypothetical protein